MGPQNAGTDREAPPPSHRHESLDQCWKYPPHLAWKMWGGLVEIPAYTAPPRVLSLGDCSGEGQVLRAVDPE